MKDTKQQLWERFKRFCFEFPPAGFDLDISRMHIQDEDLDSLREPFEHAFRAMADLERGAIANPDENRMVGHYWLRAPELAPGAGLAQSIRDTLRNVKTFAADVHRGVVRGAKGAFRKALLIGIGGSALGPQFVANALGHPKRDKLEMFFFDNTDPDGMDRVLARIGDDLGRTLCIVVSKSGGTKETRNGMLEAAAAYKAAGLDFSKHAVAVTSAGSELDKHAVANGWIARFPMWDWVGGRTSELSAVGLLPAALQGIDIDAMLEGARACDELTRVAEVRRNPAALMAAVWYLAGRGRGDRNLVVLPYKDKLELFSKYLQQLIMESIGKGLDRDGRVVNQGITVFGNKGSTDQHAYVQQLREGRNDFFVTFIEVLRDREGSSIEVEPQVTSGDYLQGFYLGTRSALYDNERQSVTITIPEVTPFAIGSLIALFERTVGLYASLININAYHQPGVEAGKKAATDVIKLQKLLLDFLRTNPGKAFSAEEIAGGLATVAGKDVRVDPEVLYKLCCHLAANPDRGVRVEKAGKGVDSRFGM